MKTFVLVLSAVAVLTVGGYVAERQIKPSAVKSTSTSSKSSTTTNSNPTFDKSLYSTTDPASRWVVVNKQRPLQPLTYAPNDLVTASVPLRVPGNQSMLLRAETAQALERLFAAIKQTGLNLMLSSGYRSYSYQVSLYNGYVQTMGQATADTQSARPGYSEHQTGLAVDVEPASRNCELDVCFSTTPEGKWLATNAYLYGFIIRYPADKVAVTGYQYEPWHIRFVGSTLASEMHRLDIQTLEEFFSLPGGSHY